MDKEIIEQLLQSVASGTLRPEEALENLRHLPFQDLGFARLDSHRAIRQGLPEVVFCPGKTDEQIAAILAQLSEHHHLVLATRATPQTAAAVKQALPNAEYHQPARIIALGTWPENKIEAEVAVLTAGTADIPVAEEACLTLRGSGLDAQRYFDIGVAGIHRLLECIQRVRKCDVAIVVAGMDGVLPSVVGGLVDCPVIAVPTAIGYGASFAGLAPLLTMLNSCAAGLTVVNIDNGFGAAVAALRIISLRTRAPSSPQ